MTNPLIACSIILFLTAAPVSLSGQVPRWYSCLRTEVPPVIDGQLEDKAWQMAPWSESFTDIEGTSAPAPLYDTRFKMLWDDNFLYVAAWLEEPHLRASLTQRDTVIFYDNDFEMFLDPNGDHHDYAELEVNASNVHWDLLLTEPYQNNYQALDAWDIRDLQKAVGLYGTLNNPSDIDSGWVVEWAIPMLTVLELYTQDSLPTEGTAWKVNFSRVQWPLIISNGAYKTGWGPWDSGRENNWVWSSQDRINMHLPEKWGVVVLETPERATSSMPDSVLRVEQIRYDLMRIYHRMRRFTRDHEQGPASLDPFLDNLSLLWIDPQLIGFSGSRFGFELTYPLDKVRTIRLTDNRQFEIVEPDDDDE